MHWCTTNSDGLYIRAEITKSPARLACTLVHYQPTWSVHWGWLYKITHQVGLYISAPPTWMVCTLWLRLQNHSPGWSVHWCTTNRDGQYIGGMVTKSPTQLVCTLVHYQFIWSVHWCTTNRDGLCIGDGFTKSPTQLVCTPVHYQSAWSVHWGWVYKITHQIGLYIGAPPIGMARTLGLRLLNHQPGWPVHQCTTNSDGLYIGAEITKTPT